MSAPSRRPSSIGDGAQPNASKEWRFLALSPDESRGKTSGFDSLSSTARALSHLPSTLAPYLPKAITSSPYYAPIVTLSVTIPTTYGLYRLLIGKRYVSAAHIPPKAFENQWKIRGLVTSVGDGDGFRMWHCPGIGWGKWRRVPTDRKELKDQTISIRLAGVDAPEAAHFGMPSQPYSAEAKAWLTSYILNKRVVVQLFNRDRYDRVLAMVYTRKFPFPFISRNISLDMLKHGWATVYVNKGAEYGGMLEKFQRAEEVARRKKRGMWAQNKADYVSPSEHKRRYLGPNEGA